MRSTTERLQGLWLEWKLNTWLRLQRDSSHFSFHPTPLSLRLFATRATSTRWGRSWRSLGLTSPPTTRWRTRSLPKKRRRRTRRQDYELGETSPWKTCYSSYLDCTVQILT